MNLQIKVANLRAKKRKGLVNWVLIFGVFTALVIVFCVWYFVLQKNSSISLISPFSLLSKEGKPVDNMPKIMNPLTGIMYPEATATWKALRPLAVMMNNHVDARPQDGLNQADLVYEIVAEGGITRYLTFFLTNNPTKIGPVRSTREYYLVFVKELGDAMLMHIGYSPQALTDIETWPVRSLSRGGASFWRDNPRNVAIEHTAYVNAVELRKVGDSLGWQGKKDFTTWQFKDIATIDTTQQCLIAECKPLQIDFWYKGDYSASFKYNRLTNTYLRFTGFDKNDQPIPTMDEVDNTQVEVKNVIVQFAPEVPLLNDEKNRLSYEVIGSGKALVFIDGKVIEATWSKADRDSRTMFYDTNGKEIEYNRGKFWISIVNEANVNQVTY